MYFDIDAHKGYFKTNPGEAYFWHGKTNGCGGPENARDIAGENGKTLERCMLDHQKELTDAGVDFYTQKNGTVRIDYGSNDDEYNRFWDDCSKAFAEQASGNVHVIEGSDPRPNGQAESDYPSVYNRIEHPALEQNQKVTSITHIDPCTKQITGVEFFDRRHSNSPTDPITPSNEDVQKAREKGVDLDGLLSNPQNDIAQKSNGIVVSAGTGGIT